MKKNQLTLVFLFCHLLVFCQRHNLDSILNLIKTDKPDTNKLFHLSRVSWEYKNAGSNDSALLYADEALSLSKTIFNNSKDPKVKELARKGEASAYNNMGNVLSNQGNYNESLQKYFASLKIREEVGDKAGAATTKSNIGLVYALQGNYAEALKSHFAALKVREELGDKKDIAASYNNIGIVYFNQENYTEALKNNFTSLKIKEGINDRSGMAYSYNNLGIVYYGQGNYEAALDNYSKSLKVKQDLGDKWGISSAYNNMGAAYSKMGDAEKDQEKNLQFALENYANALKLQEEMGDKGGITGSYVNIAIVLKKQKKYSQAKEYFMKGCELGIKIGHKKYLKNAYKAWSGLDSATGNFKGAYENHKLYILYRDSLDNEESRKKTIQSQMTFDFEKKEAIANAEHKKEMENQEALALEKSRKQQIVLFSVIGSLLLVLAFAGFIFRSLRITRKQKGIIEKQKELVEQQKREVELQKHLVEEHQKEIIDSITYARRIQRSLLPTEKYIQKSITRLHKK